MVTEHEILARTREMIEQHADGDPDKWWYVNRFVFARLQLDERKTKTAIKKKLIAAATPCYACGETFTSYRGVHLHRVDSSKGYSEDNCVLMHGTCHRKQHSDDPEKPEDTQSINDRALNLTKRSKGYEGKPWLYWWDIAPAFAEKLSDTDMVEFYCKDTGERCVVSAVELKPFLTPDRQTSRGQGHWGVKVLRHRTDELAFEPPTGSDKWLFLPVTWLVEEDDD